MAMRVQSWLALLRAAKPESAVEIEVGTGERAVDADIAWATPFLRFARTSRAMLIVKIPATCTRVGCLDMLAMLCADCCISLTADSVPILWTAEQPLLEECVLMLWQACGGPHAAHPSTLGSLRAAHVLCTEAELAAHRASRHCSRSRCLLGMRRLGTLSADDIDKHHFNFFFCPKILHYNSVVEQEQVLEPSLTLEVPSNLVDGRGSDGLVPAASSPTSLTVHASVEEDDGGGGSCTLQLVLKAAIIDLSAAEIATALKTSLRDTRCVRVRVVLPADASRAAQLIPGPVARGETTMYKWFRKWELLQLQICRVGPVACELLGPTCPALLGLFFAADARLWPSSCPRVGFALAGHLPGPAMMRHLSRLGGGTLRALLLHGLPLADAAAAGLVSQLSLGGDAAARHSSTDENSSSIPPPSAKLTVEAAETCAQSAERVSSAHGTSHEGSLEVEPLHQLLRALPPALARLARPPTRRPICSLVGLQLSLPAKEFEVSQAQVCKKLGLVGTNLAAPFAAEHIERRTLAEMSMDEAPFDEGESGGGGGSRTQDVLTERHVHWACRLLTEAIAGACADAGKAVNDVRYLSICTSTGMHTCLPGLTAYVCRDLGLSHTVVRSDIVGMGCHAGLNSLLAAA